MVALGQPNDGLVPVAIVISRSTENYSHHSVLKVSEFNLPLKDGYVIPRYYVIPQSKLEDILDASGINNQAQQEIKDHTMSPHNLEKLLGYTKSKYLNDQPDDNC
jgi:hypothetical protein